ncbi:MAG TPA: CapA family protein [Mobilitalea sp.]|nr:CapA family protein [Mobilitalea sp.]
MKKKNLIILTVICILSLSVLSGLLVYAFDLQPKRDLKDKAEKQGNELNTELNSDLNTAAEVSPTVTEAASPTPSGTAPSVTAAPDQAVPTGTASQDTSSNITATPTPAAEESSLTEIEHSDTEPIILGFAGDVNLDESSYPAIKYDAVGKDINGCFSADLLEEMNSSDIMMLNNEFSYSTRGTKTLDKSYTFRADPSRVEILKKMGVDIVSLANNHALDYGPDALLDTFDTLDNAGIDYIGAGKNLDRAKAPIYYSVGNKTIAYVAASRVVFSMDWYASENGLGMVGTYDPALILASIKEAKANSDFVVIFVHWGVERESHPEDYQRNLAKQYIDAGADAVVGCHPHVMQGLEFYKGKPIAYSLGNFWFNKSTQKSGMLKLYLEPDNTVKVQMLPAVANDTYTYLLTKDADKADYYDFIKGLSYNVNIDKDGFITKAE